MDNSPHKKNETGFFKEVWKAHNSLVEYCRSIAVSQAGSRGVVVHRTVNGTILNVDRKASDPPVPTVVDRYIVGIIEDDYLKCQKLNNDGTIASVVDGDNQIVYTKIAKPFNLRKTGWHLLTVQYYNDENPTLLGVQIHYTYTSVVMRVARIGGPTSTDIEQQVIRPSYIPNKSIIFATKVENKTGVSLVDSDLIDINADGRAWASVL
jgi:hypothetical protein